ncbi:MAG: glycosyltransferase family 9 protein [Bdellovibrionales bacterium]
MAFPRILIIHLEALGAVLRATSILPAIKRKYPKSHITWVTQAPAEQLLKPSSLIDRVLTTKSDDQLVLGALKFDLAFVIDKSLKAAGVLALTKAKEVRGFIVDGWNAAIRPANPEAEGLWRLGLDDNLKFHINRKPETQLMVEALALGDFRRDEYQVELSPAEKAQVEERRKKWLGRNELIIGLNTGCSGVIPYKRWTVEYHQRLIREIQNQFQASVVLLGGPEDEIRNQQMAAGAKVIQSPTTAGPRDGLVSVAACDMVVSGDSLGMHMAIALKKWTVAWFGPTCAHEIDLYERGVHLQAQVHCSPCWKRSCSNAVMCYDQVPVEKVLEALRQGQTWILASKMSSSKPPFLETSSLASP